MFEKSYKLEFPFKGESFLSCCFFFSYLAMKNRREIDMTFLSDGLFTG